MKFQILNYIFSCVTFISLAQVANPPSNIELCDVDNPGNEIEFFDLTIREIEILNGQNPADFSITYYNSQLDADSASNPIVSPTAFMNFSNPQTVYVRLEDISNGNFDTTTLTISVLALPTPNPIPPDLEVCDDDNDGFAQFNLLANEILILNGEQDVILSFYETPNDASFGINPIIDPSNYINIVANSQTIYARVENVITGCFALLDFDILVNTAPAVVAVTDFTICELNSDGFANFDLTFKDAEVLNGQDPATFSVSYHATLADAETNTNALFSPYTNTSNPQEIYVTITDNTTGCSISTQRFYLRVDEDAQANSDGIPIIYEICDDNLETDGDTTNDSSQFDLSILDSQVLDGQNSSIFEVSYFASETDANLGINPLPMLFENTMNPQVVYTRVDNNTIEILPIALDLSTLTEGLDLNADGTIDTFDTDGDGIFDLIDVLGNFPDGIDINGDGIFEFIDIDGDGLGNPVDLNNDGIFDNIEDISDCFAIAPITLQVNPLSILEIEDFNLCQGETLLVDTGLNTQNFSYAWSFGGALILNETGPTLLVNQAGSYSVEVINLQSGCTVFNSFMVVDVDCTDTDADGVIDSDEDINGNGNLDDDDTDNDNIPNYLDNDDDGDNVPTTIEINVVSGRSNTQHAFVDTDLDTIENYLDEDDDDDGVLTIDEDYNNNGDPTDDDTNTNMVPDYLDNQVALSVNSFSQSSFYLIPNPATTSVLLQTGKQNSDFKLEIFDIQGKLLQTQIINTNHSLNVSQFKTGVYFVRLTHGDASQTEKLIIR